MSMRKPAPSRRSLRPLAESLETRQLLSSLSTVPTATVSGTDTKGDRWTLTLYGPGTLNVVDKNGTAFTPANQFTPDDINTITVSGTITQRAGWSARSPSFPRIPMAGCSSSNSRSTTPARTGSSTRTWCTPGPRLRRTASRPWTCRTSGWERRAGLRRPPRRISMRSGNAIQSGGRDQCSRGYQHPSLRGRGHDLHPHRWNAP